MFPIVYKVVRKEDRKLVSVFAKGKAQVEYCVNKWAEAAPYLAAAGWHLFVFFTKVKALDFAERNVAWPQGRLFAAEAEELLPLPIGALDGPAMEQGLIRPSTYPQLFAEDIGMARRLRLIGIGERVGYKRTTY